MKVLVPHQRTEAVANMVTLAMANMEGIDEAVGRGDLEAVQAKAEHVKDWCDIIIRTCRKLQEAS